MASDVMCGVGGMESFFKGFDHAPLSIWATQTGLSIFFLYFFSSFWGGAQGGGVNLERLGSEYN